MPEGLEEHYRTIRRAQLVSQYIAAFISEGEEGLRKVWKEGVDMNDIRSLESHREALATARDHATATKGLKKDPAEEWATKNARQLTVAVGSILSSETDQKKREDVWWRLHDEVPQKSGLAATYRAILLSEGRSRGIVPHTGKPKEPKSFPVAGPNTLEKKGKHHPL